MPSKGQLQTTLKEKFGINKNITQSLSAEDCESLLDLLRTQPSTGRLIGAFIEKNNEFSKNNRYLGQRRSQAEKKLERLQTEHQQLQSSTAELTSENQSLSLKVQTLMDQNNELFEANDQLKKDNKDLKNIVDQIRLRLAEDTKELLQFEDSEIRKAAIRLFRWTLG